MWDGLFGDSSPADAATADDSANEGIHKPCWSGLSAPGCVAEGTCAPKSANRSKLPRLLAVESEEPPELSSTPGAHGGTREHDEPCELPGFGVPVAQECRPSGSGQQHGSAELCREAASSAAGSGRPTTASPASNDMRDVGAGCVAAAWWTAGPGGTGSDME